jgi:dolichol-phosphate mannosyltransferase
MEIQSSILVIPTYNCENQIISVLNSLLEANISKYFSHVLLIDNCSSDATVLKATKFLREKTPHWLKIAKNKKNYGLGGTHKVAVKYCLEYNINGFGIIHGDDQANIQELIDNLGLINESRNASAFLGARFMPKSTLVGYSTTRKIGNIVLNFVMTVITKKRIYDMGSGLNYFKTKDLIDLDVLRLPDDLTFNNKLILAFCTDKKEFVYFPITWTESGQFSNAKLMNQGIRILGMSLRYLLTKSVSKHKYLNDYTYEILNA